MTACLESDRWHLGDSESTGKNLLYDETKLKPLGRIPNYVRWTPDTAHYLHKRSLQWNRTVTASCHQGSPSTHGQRDWQALRAKWMNECKVGRGCWETCFLEHVIWWSATLSSAQQLVIESFHSYFFRSLRGSATKSGIKSPDWGMESLEIYSNRLWDNCAERPSAKIGHPFAFVICARKRKRNDLGMLPFF